MIAAMLAAAAVTAAPAAAPAASKGPVAVCIWANMPAYREQVVGAADFATFDRLRRDYPQAEAQAAFETCVPEGSNDAAAEMAFTYFEASLWARKRLVGKFPEARLNAVDNLSEDELKYFWLQPDPKSVDPAYALARQAAWKKVYEPFGREGPGAQRDDLDTWIFSRVGWRLGELDYAGGLSRR